jgi:hypothetical protein
MAFKVWRRKTNNDVVAFTDESNTSFSPGGDLTSYNVSTEGVRPTFSPPTDAEQTAQATNELNQRMIQTLALVMRQYTNALLAGTYTNKTVADVRSDFIAAWKSLPQTQQVQVPTPRVTTRVRRSR